MTILLAPVQGRQPPPNAKVGNEGDAGDGAQIQQQTQQGSPLRYINELILVPIKAILDSSDEKQAETLISFVDLMLFIWFHLIQDYR